MEVLSARLINKMQAMEIKYLRKERGVTLINKMRNAQIREDLQMNPIKKFVEHRKLPW